MIKNELQYFNSNVMHIASTKDDDINKNRTSFKPQSDMICIENYETLKLQEMSAEIKMHQEYILYDIVPLMNSDTAMFVEAPDLLQALIKYGANCMLSYHAARHEMGMVSRDPSKLSAQLNNEQYQLLVKALRQSCEGLAN
jgi:hypothetical protein